MRAKKSIAIVGSGVSGLTCAHYLIEAPHIGSVTLFEANDYVGGHVNTVDVTLAEGKRYKRRNEIERSAIDTGFIVFNERTYPNFIRLLNELDVPFQTTDMSFSVKNPTLGLEYSGHTINTLFSQRSNLLRPKFWRFVQDILTFNKQIKALCQKYKKAKNSGDLMTTKALSQQTLENYLDDQHYGKLFVDNYLLPMVSAIWSMEIEKARDFPLVFFAEFFDNHGLLEVVNRPRWFTIKGGSKQYVSKLVARFKAKSGIILTSSPVQSVVRASESVRINFTQEGKLQSASFDEVIFACHADTTLRLLADANDTEREILSKFRFTANEAILHTDISVLPKKPLAWASWNYLLPDLKARALLDRPVRGKVSEATIKSDPAIESETTVEKIKPVLTYHMNILQRLSKRHNYLVTLNHNVNPDHIIKRINYSHPVYDIGVINAQSRWHEISAGQPHTHFCGAYWFSGFHEDGVRSGLRVCQSLGVDIDIANEVNPKDLHLITEPDEPFSHKTLPTKADRNRRQLNKRQVQDVTSSSSR